jgi:hypothetical protein
VNEATPILTATLINSLDPEGEEDEQGFSTDESDDELLTPHDDVDVNVHEPVLGDPLTTNRS